MEHVVGKNDSPEVLLLVRVRDLDLFPIGFEFAGLGLTEFLKIGFKVELEIGLVN